MHFKNIEIHNAAELRNLGDVHTLCRYPSEVQNKLTELGQAVATYTAQTELRFVQTGKEPPVITLSSPSSFRSTAVVFRGPFQTGQFFILGPEPQKLTLNASLRSTWLPEELQNHDSFGVDVWRIVISEQPVLIYDVEGECRPPKAEELPKKTLMTYGTSITQGANATLPHLSYASLTARRLNMDLLNLGLGGSCMCEPEAVDWIASKRDWDVGILSLSVNMLPDFDIKEYEKRTRYAISTIADSDPTRPIFVFSLFPHHRDLLPTEINEHAAPPPKPYRETIHSIVEDLQRPNVHLIKGFDLLKDIDGLSTDLIHPGDHGMIEISNRLVPKMQAVLHP